MATSFKGARRKDSSLRTTFPALQKGTVVAVELLSENVTCYTLRSADGAPLAPFKAGGSLPVELNIGSAPVEYPFPIASSPREATQGIYRIAVKRGTGGYASTLICDTWAVGDSVDLGMPVEDDALSRLDPGDKLIAIAASIGVVPFHSLAKAIAEGDVDLRLTLFTVAGTYDQLLFREEWTELQEKSCGKLAVIPVLADERRPPYAHGQLTRKLIEQYANTEEAVFLVCGPASLVAAMCMELAPWKLSRRRLRSTFTGESESKPKNLGTAEHQIVIRLDGTTHTLPARENETVLEALEKVGFQPPANCRSGVCGYCHATLISGEYFLATDKAGERKMHDRSSFFHPCCSYPASDMEIVLRPTKTSKHQ